MYRLGENAKAERAFGSFGGQTAFLSGRPAPESVRRGTRPFVPAEAGSGSVSWPFLYHGEPVLVILRAFKICKDVLPLTSKAPLKLPPRTAG